MYKPRVIMERVQLYFMVWPHCVVSALWLAVYRTSKNVGKLQGDWSDTLQTHMKCACPPWRETLKNYLTFVSLTLFFVTMRLFFFFPKTILILLFCIHNLLMIHQTFKSWVILTPFFNCVLIECQLIIIWTWV
jgi:hypothetical protein